MLGHYDYTDYIPHITGPDVVVTYSLDTMLTHIVFIVYNDWLLLL